jgi:hypothetical protein
MATPSPNGMAVTTWAELLKAVDGNNGLSRVTMATLRELEGAERLGKHVLTAIATKLSQLGLGHLPEELPNRQDQPVMIYKVGTPAADAIRAIRMTMITGIVDMSLYHVLIQLNKLPDPTQVLMRDQVRASANEAVDVVIRLLQELNPGMELSDLPHHRPEEMV